MGAHPQRADAASKVELAQIFARYGAAYLATHHLATVQYRAMRAIQACRTEVLGGHVARCDACGRLRYSYHSCRNRHCPKCQTLAKERWLAARQAELLPVPYYHVVFTLPHELNGLAQGNPRVIYRLLFDAAARTIRRVRYRAYRHAALTLLQRSAIVIRIAVAPLTSLRAPHVPRNLRSLLVLPPPGAPRSAFKFQTPSH